eukprot:TRINITY_DN68221_c0_g1_i1.p1 TRINITY_DN68221_c0_g1~~TRINITY_DN68221_c0_g1_i1.p1  ORF type:complete len:237 (+),score=16.97 TRINITY_DN68221_c0_g1_i1:119-829(+)
MSSVPSVRMLFAASRPLCATHLKKTNTRTTPLRDAHPPTPFNQWLTFRGSLATRGHVVRCVSGFSNVTAPDGGQVNRFPPGSGVGFSDRFYRDGHYGFVKHTYMVANAPGIVRVSPHIVSNRQYTWVDTNIWETTARRNTYRELDDLGVAFTDRSGYTRMYWDYVGRAGGHVVLPSVSGRIDYHEEHEFDPRRNVLGRPHPRVGGAQETVRRASVNLKSEQEERVVDATTEWSTQF